MAVSADFLDGYRQATATMQDRVDRLQWARFCDAWVAIGLAATLELVIDDTPPWEPPRPRGVARNAIARRLGIPAAEAK